jgi:hypothetical protein
MPIKKMSKMKLKKGNKRKNLRLTHYNSKQSINKLTRNNLSTFHRVGTNLKEHNYFQYKKNKAV